MSIYKMVADTIKRYGNKVEITTKNKTEHTKAFVEPLRYKNKIYVGDVKRLMGSDRTEKYLYVGLPENPLVENCSVIETAERKYIVNRCENYYVNDMPVYVWAILKAHGNDLEDDYEPDRKTG